MFGSGIGEKKRRINEMAAYYLARVVFFVFFYLLGSTVCLLSKCMQGGSYSMNHVCSHILMHIFMHILENITLCLHSV